MCTIKFHTVYRSYCMHKIIKVNRVKKTTKTQGPIFPSLIEVIQKKEKK